MSVLGNHRLCDECRNDGAIIQHFTTEAEEYAEIFRSPLVQADEVGLFPEDGYGILGAEDY